MAVNVTANFQLIRCMEPPLKKSDAGRAVFVTSGAASQATAYLAPYTASKAALETLARAWPQETGAQLRVTFQPRPYRPGCAPLFPVKTRRRWIRRNRPPNSSYRCAPGMERDRQTLHYKTRTLLSFRPPA